MISPWGSCCLIMDPRSSIVTILAASITYVLCERDYKQDKEMVWILR